MGTPFQGLGMWGEFCNPLPTHFFSFSSIPAIRKSAMLAHLGMGNSIFGVLMVFPLARLLKVLSRKKVVAHNILLSAKKTRIVEKKNCKHVCIPLYSKPAT